MSIRAAVIVARVNAVIRSPSLLVFRAHGEREISASLVARRVDAERGIERRYRGIGLSRGDVNGAECIPRLEIIPVDRDRLTLELLGSRQIAASVGDRREIVVRPYVARFVGQDGLQRFLGGLQP